MRTEVKESDIHSCNGRLCQAGQTDEQRIAWYILNRSDLDNNQIALQLFRGQEYVFSDGRKELNPSLMRLIVKVAEMREHLALEQEREISNAQLRKRKSKGCTSSVGRSSKPKVRVKNSGVKRSHTRMVQR